MIATTYIQQINITVKSDDLQLLQDLRTHAYADLDIMMKSGVFSFRNGVAEIHRDNDGNIRSIAIKQQTHKV